MLVRYTLAAIGASLWAAAGAATVASTVHETGVWKTNVQVYSNKSGLQFQALWQPTSTVTTTQNPGSTATGEARFLGVAGSANRLTASVSLNYDLDAVAQFDSVAKNSFSGYATIRAIWSSPVPLGTVTNFSAQTVPVYSTIDYLLPTVTLRSESGIFSPHNGNRQTYAALRYEVQGANARTYQLGHSLGSDDEYNYSRGVNYRPFFLGVGETMDVYATIYTAIGVGATSVPEPSLWALLILGFGAVGARLRRVNARGNATQGFATT
jgi:hypothetical protein